MRLEPDQTDEAFLRKLGQAAVALLTEHRLGDLAAQFGYALACGRDPATALQTDLDQCLATVRPVVEPQGRAGEEIRVKYFEPNKSNLVAVVECDCFVSQRFPILLELIVSSGRDGFHIMVEDVSAGSGP